MQEKWALFSRGGAEKLASEYSIPFLGAIPLDPVCYSACHFSGRWSTLGFLNAGTGVVL